MDVESFLESQTGANDVMDTAMGYGEKQPDWMAQSDFAILRKEEAKYGATHHAPKRAVYTRRQRQRMNVNSAFGSLFVPWIMFCLIHACVSFHIHYAHPIITKLVVGACWILTFVVGILAVKAVLLKQRKHHIKKENVEPTWWVFTFITMCIAVTVATVLGTINFFSFMQRYYDFASLNVYKHVDVSTTKGPQIMDAAKVDFINSTVLDLTKSMAFRNLRTYCVAPITVTNENNVRTELGNYDFWAVGMDCCSGDTADFRCGEWSNYQAHGGLRLLADEERAFYRLAVQQAESTYHIRSNHPLFFYWVEDPDGGMEAWRIEGYMFFFLAMIVHFIFQCMVVVMAVLGFAHYGNF